MFSMMQNSGKKRIGLKDVYLQGYFRMVPGIFNCKFMIKQPGKQEKLRLPSTFSLSSHSDLITG